MVYDAVVDMREACMNKPEANSNNIPIKEFYLHLVSDATGATLQGLASACLAQFQNIHAIERFWPLVRSSKQLERVIKDIQDHPGIVFFTFVDEELRRTLQKSCKAIDVPCINALESIMRGLSSYTGLAAQGVPGLQHALDQQYFDRIDAIDFALSFDDGQNYDGIEDADVVLVGVSRTSKTPTCIYLARQGVRAANIPLAPGIPFPNHVLKLRHPLFVGLTESPDRLIQLRSSRMKLDNRQHGLFSNSYLDPEQVETEVQDARRFFREQGWPVIDVTKRSVEETAAEIMFLLQRKRADEEHES